MPCTWLVVFINVGSNLAGFFVVYSLFRFADPLGELRNLSSSAGLLIAALLGLLVPASIAFLHYVAMPIDRAVSALNIGGFLDAGVLETARRRVINLPFLAGLMNLMAWVIPAVAFPAWSWYQHPEAALNVGVHILYNFSNAVMITLLAFVLLEEACRRLVIPRLFPDGRLREQPGTLVLTIRAKLMILYGAVCFIPMFQMVLIVNANALHPPQSLDPSHILSNLASFSTILFLVIAGYGLWLALLFSRNVAKPARDVMQVTERIRAGDYDVRVTVVSNDEIGYLGDRVNEMACGLREREEIRAVFNLVTSPEISKEILSDRTFDRAQTRRVTLLFSDLRGFTTMAEQLPPEEVLDSINRYFDEMSTAIVDNGGIVLQYVGDEIEAVFGAPLEDDHQADKAVSAALAMRAKLDGLNKERVRLGKDPLRHGIGIHTGAALAGIVGSKYKISYAMVGDTVNLASRIQDLTKELGGDILISDETFSTLSVSREVEGPVTVSVKGKTKVVEVYRVL
ncbi:adenylate/guanylate cyclase domain-containing protein [Thermodesulfobacteriota bacterium]